MAQSDPTRWKQPPGSLDALHGRHLFASDNPWGIPTLRRAPLADTPVWLAPYRTRIRSEQALEGAIHFFLDDYRFEAVWNRPWQTLSAVRQCPLVLSPDFSLYRDWPLTLQLWNTYRNRWCGAFWQAQGLHVIPTLSWGAPESYDFCFLGVEPHSLVAVSTVGLRRQGPLADALFMEGFGEMVRRLRPSRVLCYGEPPEAAHRLAEIVTYPPFWKGLQAARRQGRAEPISGNPGRQRDGTVTGSSAPVGRTLIAERRDGR